MLIDFTPEKFKQELEVIGKYFPEWRTYFKCFVLYRVINNGFDACQLMLDNYPEFNIRFDSWYVKRGFTNVRGNLIIVSSYKDYYVENTHFHYYPVKFSLTDLDNPEIIDRKIKTIFLLS